MEKLTAPILDLLDDLVALRASQQLDDLLGARLEQRFPTTRARDPPVIQVWNQLAVNNLLEQRDCREPAPQRQLIRQQRVVDDEAGLTHISSPGSLAISARSAFIRAARCICVSDGKLSFSEMIPLTP